MKVRMRVLEVPPSRYLSQAGREALGRVHAVPWSEQDAVSVQAFREWFERYSQPSLTKIRAAFPVEVRDEIIAGTHAIRVLVPGAQEAHRVILSLHGGGFFTGNGAHALIESIPFAACSGVPVLSVDYRLAPEHPYPAAVEDVLAVYRALLDRYSPESIGLLGCSAGGALGAMCIASMRTALLPMPGALVLLSSGAFADMVGNPLSAGTWGGDSRYFAAALANRPYPRADGIPPPSPAFMGAFLDGLDVADPLLSPAESQEVLASFPPTLLASGTRSFDLSAVVETHRRLVKAGVVADLHVWDGVNHCFFNNADLPESHELYSVVASFLEEHLGA
jgi:epsilon-lactone hydrolase